MQNSYVASQHFNEQAAEKKAQAASGLTGRLTVDNGAVAYAIVDARGQVRTMSAARISFHRPVSGFHDRDAQLAAGSDGAAAATLDLPDGVWIVSVTADAGLPHPWRDMRRIVITGGVFR